MVMDLGHHARPLMNLQTSPLLVTFAELLELPSIELEQRIDHELERNPALERVESTGCGVCGDQARSCPECSGPHWGAAMPTRTLDDALASAVEPSSLYRTVLDEARLELTGQDQVVAEYLFDSLDERGFLTSSLEEICAALRVSKTTLTRLLEVLRGMGSPGLGARDLRECLLLQLDQLERLGPSQPLVRQLLAEHLEGLARGGAGQLASVLGVSVEEVQSAREFIRTQLRPLGSPAELEPWARPACAPRLVPDVAISFADVQPLSIEVEVLSPVALRVAPLYRQVAAAAADQHVVDSVRRAESFLLLLDRRAETLRNVAQRAASAQVTLLLHGRPAPRPPTRAEVASELGLHGSTVSRAVANKVAVLPGHRLMPLSGLFEIRPAVEDALRQLIGAEEQPLSDGQLAARLTTLGYRVARRTVAKYRDRLCLPVATARS